MTANHRKDALEVAHITGVQGIRAAMARLADEEADVPLPGATPEEVPLGRLTFDIAVWFQKICRLPSGGFSDLLDVRCNSQRERRRVFAASYRDSLAVAFERIVARIGHV